MNKILNTLKKSRYSELAIIDNKILSFLNSNENELNSYYKKFLFNGAKRLRPLFILLVCELEEFEIDDDIYNLICAVELIHNASLIHDDILDEALTRRNEECIHITKGNKIAVLAGDYLLTEAMDFLSEIKNKKVYKTIANAAKDMTKSEIKSLLNRFNRINLEDYLLISKEKTSSLFVAAVKSLYEIKGIKENQTLIDFSEKFSLCFQLKDDINNFLNKDENKCAKDNLQGVYTLPLILRENIKNNYDIIQKSNEFLNNLINEAKKLLAGYKDSKAKEDIFSLIELFKG